MMLALYDIDMTHETGDDQTRLWNGPGGDAWVDEQELLDRLLKPFETLLIEAVAARSPKQLLDVGCGTGSTTLAAARLLGAQGRCIGVDISAPMIAAARARAEREGSQARFICANAEDHAFDPASADMIISRFGVMFFDDSVRAFANLRRAATGDAEMRCIAWRSAAENPFMTAAERAAAPLLPNLPVRRPDAPGQFAFGNRDRVRSILEKSGWAEIDIRPIDVASALPEKELVRYVTRFGPVGRILQDADAQTRARVIDAIRPAFDPYVHGDEVRVVAACWIICGQADPSYPSSQ
ncbi:MAG TPA: class I SAM-dependent methyltransferase [Vicinamibacterales bacterium]|nr:class I SAM-dependent methyltransferase [Vicinamibacterales bacterium]